MRLLDRYLLRELVFWLAIFFVSFLLVWVVLDMIGELQNLTEHGLHAGEIFRLYVYRVPEFLPIAMPVSLLLAALYALTQHSRYNEITAIRATGVSLGRVCASYFAVGLVLSAGLFAANEVWGPGAAARADEIAGGQRINKTIVPKLDFVNSRPGEYRKWYADVYDLRTQVMTNPLVTAPGYLIFAERAVWTNNAWHFLNAHESYFGTNGLPSRRLQSNDLAKVDFSETPKEIQSELAVNDHFSVDLHRRTRRADVPLGDVWDYLWLHPHPDPKIGAYVRTQLHGRFAGPCACLVVVLISVPFAAGSGRRNIFVGVAASIFIFFAYFLVQQLGLAYGEAGRIPAWLAAWLPNLLFGAAGFWMMMRVR